MHATKTISILPDDTARTRRGDPLVSHLAADKSARTLGKVKRAALVIIWEHPLIIGHEINTLYRGHYRAREWPRSAWDSPRKRAGELLKDGYILDQGMRDGSRQFIVSVAGLRLLMPAWSPEIVAQANLEDTQNDALESGAWSPEEQTWADFANRWIDPVQARQDAEEQEGIERGERAKEYEQ